MEQGVEDVLGLEVVLPALEVDVTARGEAAFLVENESHAPRLASNRPAATAARRLSAARALGAVDAGKAVISDTGAGDVLELLAIAHRRRGGAERFQEWLRAFVGGARRMEPQHRVAL